MKFFLRSRRSTSKNSGSVPMPTINPTVRTHKKVQCLYMHERVQDSALQLDPRCAVLCYSCQLNGVLSVRECSCTAGTCPLRNCR